MGQLISLPITPHQGEQMSFLSRANKITDWHTVAKTYLKGRTIVDVRYLNAMEVEEMGWYRSGLMLFLDNGSQVMVQQDDEGNGPGALSVTTSNDGFVLLPTIFR
jgi:hypothetical protein